jgi:tripartite-type tricarboxylate transporter receptor subunit TctC
MTKNRVKRILREGGLALRTSRNTIGHVAPGRGRVVAVLLAALSGALPHAAAQNYPTRPIRVVVPFPPGGTSDILARLIGARIAESWGQQLIVDNRPGANGNIGAELVARAAPDGYTVILMDIGNLAISPSLFQKLPFDILRDFAPVTTVSSEQRLPALPEAPTVAETLPGFVTGSWQGMLAPARTPPDVIARLNGEVARILSLPDVREKLSSQGTAPLPQSPEGTGKWLAAEKERWAKLVKETGFRLDQ